MERSAGRPSRPCELVKLLEGNGGDGAWRLGPPEEAGTNLAILFYFNHSISCQQVEASSPIVVVVVAGVFVISRSQRLKLKGPNTMANLADQQHVSLLLLGS